MGNFTPVSSRLNEISGEVVDACFYVHESLGPGLLESAYHICLEYELKTRGLIVDSNHPVPVVYRDVKLEAGFRIDLLVEHEIVVELKAVDIMHPVYEAQLLTYLKLSGKRLGLLINFNVPLIKDGIRRFVL